MSQTKIVVICFIFSLICSIVKQLYDKKCYTDNSVGAILVRIVLSAITGLIVALIGTAYVSNVFVLIGCSGIAGLFGTSTMRIITRFLLGQKVIRIQITDDDEPIDIRHNENRLDDEIIEGSLLDPHEDTKDDTKDGQ